MRFYTYSYISVNDPRELSTQQLPDGLETNLDKSVSCVVDINTMHHIIDGEHLGDEKWSGYITFLFGDHMPIKGMFVHEFIAEHGFCKFEAYDKAMYTMNEGSSIMVHFSGEDPKKRHVIYVEDDVLKVLPFNKYVKTLSIPQRLKLLLVLGKNFLIR